MARDWAIANGLAHGLDVPTQGYVDTHCHHQRVGNLIRYPAHWDHNLGIGRSDHGPWKCDSACKEVTGRAAGAIRNKRQLESNPQVVLAWHHNIRESKGTLNMLMVAKKAGIPHYVIGGWKPQPEPETLGL
jgi:hypothetical protein